METHHSIIKGKTPLHDAASNGHTETVRALGKELDADVNARDNEGRIPFDHVGEHERQEELSALLIQ